jgi:hypothetical protein
MDEKFDVLTRDQIPRHSVTLLCDPVGGGNPTCGPVSKLLYDLVDVQTDPEPVLFLLVPTTKAAEDVRLPEHLPLQVISNMGDLEAVKGYCRSPERCIVIAYACSAHVILDLLSIRESAQIIIVDNDLNPTYFPHIDYLLLEKGMSSQVSDFVFPKYIEDNRMKRRLFRQLALENEKPYLFLHLRKSLDICGYKRDRDVPNTPEIKTNTDNIANISTNTRFDFEHAKPMRAVAIVANEGDNVSDLIREIVRHYNPQCSTIHLRPDCEPSEPLHLFRSPWKLCKWIQMKKRCDGGKEFAVIVDRFSFRQPVKSIRSLIVEPSLYSTLTIWIVRNINDFCEDMTKHLDYVFQRNPSVREMKEICDQLYPGCAFPKPEIEYDHYVVYCPRDESAIFVLENTALGENFGRSKETEDVTSRKLEKFDLLHANICTVAICGRDRQQSERLLDLLRKEHAPRESRCYFIRQNGGIIRNNSRKNELCEYSEFTALLLSGNYDCILVVEDFNENYWNNPHFRDFLWTAYRRDDQLRVVLMVEDISNVPVSCFNSLGCVFHRPENNDTVIDAFGRIVPSISMRAIRSVRDLIRDECAFAVYPMTGPGLCRSAYRLDITSAEKDSEEDSEEDIKESGKTNQKKSESSHVYRICDIAEVSARLQELEETVDTLFRYRKNIL